MFDRKQNIPMSPLAAASLALRENSQQTVFNREFWP